MYVCLVYDVVFGRTWSLACQFREEQDKTTPKKPNLDDCVEVNGYLEPADLGHQSNLKRHDTIPKYHAPVPTLSTYGMSQFTCVL